MKHLKQTVELGSTLVIAVVAVAMAYTYFQERRPSQGAGTREIADWERENEIGIRSGPADAVVVITEFVDLQCPFCAALAPIIDSIAAEFPDDVAVVFQHFPLQSHEHAIPAAIAAECAERQARFWPMYRLLLSGQRSFPWEQFAEDAGVSNLAAFADCMTLPQDSFPRIAAGRALGERTGVVGTPTTWVNGRVARPTMEMVRGMLESTRRTGR